MINEASTTDWWKSACTDFAAADFVCIFSHRKLVSLIAAPETYLQNMSKIQFSFQRLTATKWHDTQPGTNPSAVLSFKYLVNHSDYRQPQRKCHQIFKHAQAAVFLCSILRSD